MAAVCYHSQNMLISLVWYAHPFLAANNNLSIILLADLGPKPGNLENCFISSSISGTLLLI